VTQVAICSSPFEVHRGGASNAGILRDGRQALIARSVYGQLIAAICDGGGNLIQVVDQQLPNPPSCALGLQSDPGS
jgi:hypothetical protein